MKTMRHVLGQEPSIERVVIIEDLFGKLRLVLWAQLFAGGDLERRLREELKSVAAPIGRQKSGWHIKVIPPIRRSINRAWAEARPVEDTKERLRIADRHRTRGAWLREMAEPPWQWIAGSQETPPILLFYSFKGGVGRSTAIASFAIKRAAEGDRVVVIDFDLDHQESAFCWRRINWELLLLGELWIIFSSRFLRSYRFARLLPRLSTVCGVHAVRRNSSVSGRKLEFELSRQTGKDRFSFPSATHFTPCQATASGARRAQTGLDSSGLAYGPFRINRTAHRRCSPPACAVWHLRRTKLAGTAIESSSVLVPRESSQINRHSSACLYTRSSRRTPTPSLQSLDLPNVLRMNSRSITMLPTRTIRRKTNFGTCVTWKTTTDRTPPSRFPTSQYFRILTLWRTWLTILSILQSTYRLRIVSLLDSCRGESSNGETRG